MTEPGTARGPADIRNLLPAAGVDARNRFLFARGQQIAPHLPSSVQNLIMNLGSAMSLARPSPEIDNWIANITAATGTRPGRALQRQAIRSYLRTYLEVLALPSWGPLRTATAVSAEPTGNGSCAWPTPGPAWSVHCRTRPTGTWPVAGLLPPGCRSPRSPSVWGDRVRRLHRDPPPPRHRDSRPRRFLGGPGADPCGPQPTGGLPDG